MALEFLGCRQHWFVGRLLFAHIFAFVLLLSWFIEPGRQYWLDLDVWVFRYFNDGLKTGSEAWRMLWALTNHRLFDLVSALILGLVFVISGVKQGRQTWARHAAILCVTALVAFLGTRIGHLIPADRASGTVIFSDVFLLNDWATGFKTKDISYSTFPGDHGMVALIGCGFAFFYLQRCYAFASIIAGLIIVVPRLVGGAHWMSDELVGAGFVGIVVLSWAFCSPLANYLVAKFEPYWEYLFTRLSI